MNRRQLLATTPALLLLPAACVNQPTDPTQKLYQQAIAGQKAAGILFSAGAALVAAGVIKKPSSFHDTIDAAFSGLADAGDAVNSNIQSGNISVIDTLLAVLMSAIGSVRQQLYSTKPTAAQQSALLAEHPMAAKALDVTAILKLIMSLLPAIGPLASLIASFISGLFWPKDDVVLAPTDVQAANDEMHQGLLAWIAA